MKNYFPTRYQVLIICVLILGILIHPFDPFSLDGNTNSSLKFSSSSEDLLHLPSFKPNIFHSDSGKLHLLFQHEVHMTDVVLYKYYHMYTYENGSWSHPKQLNTPYHAFDQQIVHINPNENGFTLYYSLSHQGVYAWTYQEQEDSWEDPDLIFGRSDAIEFLQSGENTILHLHGFLLLGTDEVYITWSFEAEGSPHHYEELYIISTVYSNGSIVSQALSDSSESYSTQAGIIFLPTNSTIFLFKGSGHERVVVLSDITWSNWQSPSQEEQTLFKLYRTFTGAPPKHYEILTFIEFTRRIALENISSNFFTPPFDPLVGTDYILNLSS